MKIIKNYLYNVGYQLFVIIIPLVTIPYVSRILGSNGIGINAYTNSIIQYFILFGSIGINLYGNRTIAYSRDNKKNMSQTFWEIIILRLICIVISYLLFLLFLFFTKEYKIYYFYQSFFIIAAGFDISWFFMGIEDFRKTVLRNIFVKIASLIAVFIFVKTESDVGKYILVLSISTLMGNLTLWPYLHRFVSRPDFTKLDLWKHFFPSLTLFIPQIATQVYLVLNKTMLGAMEGVKSAGYYENSDKIVKVILAIITATGTVMLPRVANTYAKGNKEKVYQYLVLSFDFVSSICIPMALGLAAIAPKFSIWFLGSDFAITGKIISILSLVIIFIGWSNVLGTQYLLPTNQTRYYTISVISGASINLIMNIPLIQIFGIYGAVISTVLSELTVTTVQLFFIKRTIKLSKLFTGKWKYFLSAALMFIVVRYMHVMLPSGLLFFTIEAFLGILIYFLLLYLLKAPILNLAITIIRKRFH
ncbi:MULTISPECIES: flippase [Enterococcus]|uniref:flippase n=1 Tax=Enterococcus TaxID=1350 RepID=UPI000C313822|nr:MULTISPECIES: flippase [Enterococcus]AUC72465.1 flippase [Enterococcus faecium]MCW8794434.1 flippase [Enterococcus faecium]MDT2324193.1 flippase [Enterococcus faecium]MDV4992826.1 flippase [Enterococcus faecium]NTM15342.1 flippase [Enterococcus faecium]